MEFINNEIFQYITACVTCKVGIADYDSCTCIDFNDSEDVKDIIDELEDIKISINGTTNQNITDVIADIQKEIDDLLQYIKDNKDNLDNKYISIRILIIKKMISDLNFLVQEFISSLKPNLDCPNKCSYNYTLNPKTCSCLCGFLDCNILAGEYENYNYCQCMRYDDYIILYNVRNNLSALIAQLHADGADPIKVTGFLVRTFPMYYNSSSIMNSIRFSSLNANYTKWSIEIRELEKQKKELFSEYNAWSLIAEGNCPNVCKTNEIQIKNCTCYSSSTVRSYHAQLYTLSYFQINILRYTGRGDKTELKQFQDRALSVRFNFEEAFIFLSRYSDNIGECKFKVEIALNKSMQLRSDYNAWYLLQYPPSTATPTPCYVCGPSQIEKNCYSCITIIDWDKLANVEKGLPGLLIEINNLNNSTNQNMLKTNW